MEAKDRRDPEKQKDQVARAMQIPGSDVHQAIRQACPGYSSCRARSNQSNGQDAWQLSRPTGRQDFAPQARRLG